MMKVKVAKVGTGLHPTEVVVSINTTEGEQHLVISDRSLDGNGFINVGYAIRQKGDDFLVELPRETMSGSWRVWVNKNQIQQENERQIA